MRVCLDLWEHRLVPRYDVMCEAHGEHEVFRHIAVGVPFKCGVDAACESKTTQLFKPSSIPAARIDCAGEDSKLEARVKDGTSKFNMGLGGIDRVVGTRPDGSPALAYRPITNAEVGSNRNAREIAKRQGLVPIESGTYRPLGR